MAFTDCTAPRARTRVFRGTPGYDELLTLRVFSRRVRSTDTRRIVAQLRGYVDLDCGTPGGHRVAIREDADVFVTEQGASVFARAKAGDADAAEEVVASLHEWALERWSCDCLDGELL